jgi:hypothetical protein
MGELELAFADLLAVSPYLVLLTDDEEFKAVLDSYGISFERTRGVADLAIRANLLACVALLYTHHAELGPVLSKLSVANCCP